jgi:hypothetical protein
VGISRRSTPNAARQQPVTPPAKRHEGETQLDHEGIGQMERPTLQHPPRRPQPGLPFDLPQVPTGLSAMAGPAALSTCVVEAALMAA